MIKFNSYQWENAVDVLVVELAGKLDTDSAETFFAQTGEGSRNRPHQSGF